MSEEMESERYPLVNFFQRVQKLEYKVTNSRLKGHFMEIKLYKIRKSIKMWKHEIILIHQKSFKILDIKMNNLMREA